MGKKKNKKAPGLGQAVINDRFGGRQVKGTDSFIHTSELNDGYDWGRLNLQSVTEQSNLDDFLATAELAGTEFAAERLNVKVIDPSSHSGILSKQEDDELSKVQEQFKDLLSIPRRPKWDENTTPDQLDLNEREAFLEWRRKLAGLQEEKKLIMTPFEKNLDFWRQLWRVIERSDIVIQIVDARNPLLFRCEDLEKYVKEIGENKINMVLVNKSDLLTERQREQWADYFSSLGLRVVFWSALMETEMQKAKAKEEEEAANNLIKEEEEEEDSEVSDKEEEKTVKDIEETNITESETKTSAIEESSEQQPDNEPDLTTSSGAEQTSSSEQDTETSSSLNNGNIVSGEDLLQLLKTVHVSEKVTPGILTVGLVGYPNVGKSSTINAILQSKKVPVSATPGRTKHFQTLFVEKDILLCDCPGLVMPTFVNTKADMVVNGILPIDQMRDHIAPVSRVCQLIPRDVLQAFYGINLPKPLEGEDPDRPPTAHELCASYGYMRGFMTPKGVPDGPRSARLILKDFVHGKLSYCHPPPGIDAESFGSAPLAPTHKAAALVARKEKEMLDRVQGPYTAGFDDGYFHQAESTVHSRGVHGVSDFARVSNYTRHFSPSSPVNLSKPQSTAQSLVGKPWKKHGNRNKREKLRRVYAHLDQH